MGLLRDHTKYFGRVMSFKDTLGNIHEESFWKLEQFSIHTKNDQLFIQFVGYKSIADFNAGGDSLLNVGGYWSKTVIGEPYDRLLVMFATAVGSVALATWSIADSVKDTPNAQSIFESFFAEAGEIIAPPELQGLFNK